MIWELLVRYRKKHNTPPVLWLISGRGTASPKRLLHAKRRERDSNPRSFGLNCFQDSRIKPLCHPSVMVDCSSMLQGNTS
jgi:hypothetical protein